MRILMTTDTVGGVWTFTTELTHQLLQRGHEVYLVSLGRAPSPEQERCFDKWPNDGRLTTLFTSIPLEWMQNNEASFEQGQEEILDDAACFRPDLILSNQFCFGALDTSIPRIIVGHSDVLSWARACRPSALEPTPWLSRYTNLVQAGLNGASAVVTPTAWMGNALAESFSLPSGFKTIPNGVSVSEPEKPLPNRRFQAITAGRLWDLAKGLDTLRDLDCRIPLLVAGDNTFESPGPQASWPGRLDSLGSLSQTALHRYFRESDFYICASRYEPFGLAPLEAALCGCVPLVRDIPSLREVWADGALYFTDDASLTQVLKALGWDYKLLTEARSRAHQRAQQFTPGRMANSYLNLFQSVLQQQQATQHVA